MQIACRHCGQKNGVDSLIKAAQQKCEGCGNFVMGDRVSSAPAESPSSSSASPYRPAAPKAARSGGNIRMGAIIGALVGLVAALAASVLEDALPIATQGMILGSLAGVLLGPVIILGIVVSAFFSKHSMFVSVDDLINESIADQITDAVNEGRFHKLITLVLGFVVLGMVVGGFGGSHVHTISPVLIVVAIAGAVSLGAVVGAPLGARFLTEEEDESPPPEKQPPSDGPDEEKPGPTPSRN